MFFSSVSRHYVAIPVVILSEALAAIVIATNEKGPRPL
jgi:hypothetical protein